MILVWTVLLDLIVVTVLASVTQDWWSLIASYSWNSSLADVVLVGLVKIACAGFRPTLYRSICLAVCSLFVLIKVITAEELHKSGMVLATLWVSLVLSIVETIVSCYEHAYSNKVSDGDNISFRYQLMEEGGGGDKYHGTGASFTRVVFLAYPERYILSIALVCLFVSSALQMLIPMLFGRVIKTISETKSEEQLDHTVLLLLVVFVVSSIFSMFRGALFNLSGERLVARFRVRLFDAVICQDITFFDESQTGELQSRLSNDTTVIQDAVTSNVSMGLRWLAQVIVGIGVLFVLSWKLTLVMLSVIPALAFGARAYGSFIKDISTAYQEALAKAAEVAAESFGSIRTVRSFNKEGHEIRLYSNRINESYKYGAKKAWAYGFFIGGIGLLAYLALALVLWYGGKLVIQGNGIMRADTLTAFLLYTVQIAFSLGGLSGLYSQLMSAVGASERMFMLIDREPTIPTKKLSDSMNIEQVAVAGKVNFDQVTFCYPTRKDMQVLKGVSFECSPGEITALVGPSGSGKSTIVSLLQRFYDPVSGSVSVDGGNLRQMSTILLHHAVSAVSQEPTLFASTIEENIRYGVHGTVSLDDIIQVAKQANAHEFISKFPSGYQTMVGERGVQLSGGQKQRIAIARAILADPKILLLDEATSALDAESEHLVQEALDRLMHNRTTLVIAHRLSTVRNASCILVLEDGVIVERGRHDDLILNDQGLYSALVKRQLSHN